MITKTITQIDIIATKKQLKYLGWKNQGEAVYTRCLKNSTAKEYSQVDFNTLDTQNQAGYGVYLIVNSRNATKPKKKMIGDENITECHAIFCEWDYKENSPNSNEQYTLDQQLIRWRDVNFLQPTFVVFSGNKSMQAYWVFNETITPDVWKDLQVKLITVMDGDKAIKNPSRLMRLAGYRHQKTGQLSTIAEDSGLKYDAQDLSDRLKAILDKPVLTNIHNDDDDDDDEKSPPDPSPKITASAIPVPFAVCLSKENRNRLKGVASDRNNQMFTLAKDLLGVEKYFRETGVYTTDDAANLFFYACQACGGDTSFTRPEWEKIWKSANERSPQSTLSPEYLQNCINAYTKKKVDAAEKKSSNNSNNDDDDDTSPTETIESIVFRELYGDGSLWRKDNDLNLYKFNGTHYELINSTDDEKRISDWCEQAATSPKIKKKDRQALDTAGRVESLHKRCKQKIKRVPPEKINANGINLRNGIFTVKVTKNGVKTKLIPHTPDLFFNYIADYSYDPNADRKDAMKVLEILEPGYRQTFLKVLAASLDLGGVREILGARKIKALLLLGEGSNGKDTFRNIMFRLYGGQVSTTGKVSGPGMANCPLMSFVLYDQGKEEKLASIDGARILWAPENVEDIGLLDRIQSLKAFITGDPLWIRTLYNNPYPIIPQGICCFNVNARPMINATTGAIIDRYAIILFNKRFVYNADPKKDQIEIDPRFKEDPNFISEMILPAFLNILVEYLEDLMKNGIDYSDSNKVIEEYSLEKNHLIRFIHEMGWKFDPKAKFTIYRLYPEYVKWAISQGLAYKETNGKGKEKIVWEVFEDDKPVKHLSHMGARLCKLFAGIKNTMCTDDQKHVIFTGLAIPDLVDEPEKKATSVFSEGHLEGQTPYQEATSSTSATFTKEFSVENKNEIPETEKLLSENFSENRPNWPQWPSGMVSDLPSDLQVAKVVIDDLEKNLGEDTEIIVDNSQEILDRLKNSVTIGDLQEVRRTYPKEKLNEVAKTIKDKEFKILKAKIAICKQLWDGAPPTDIFKDVNAVGVNETLEALKIYLDNQTPIESAIAPFKVIEDNWALLTAKAWVICNKAYERYDTLAPGVLLATIYQDDEGS